MRTCVTIVLLLLVAQSCKMDKFYARKRIGHGASASTALNLNEPAYTPETEAQAMEYPLPVSQHDKIQPDSPEVIFPAKIALPLPDSVLLPGRQPEPFFMQGPYQGTVFPKGPQATPPPNETAYVPPGWIVLLVLLAGLALAAFLAGLSTFLVSLVWISLAEAVQLGLIVFLWSMPAMLLIALLWILVANLIG